MKRTLRIENAAILKTIRESHEIFGLCTVNVFVDSLGIAVIGVFFSCVVPVTLSFLPCRQTSKELRIIDERVCLYRLIMYAAV